MMRFLFGFLTLILAFPANAQEEAPPALEAPASAESIYDLIPDEFLLEAKNFVRQCEGNSQLALYYNCECMGAAFLDERIKQGPDVSASSIELQLARGKQCKDASGIAAQRYESCFNMPVELPRDMTPEQYCECYANEFAKVFEEYGGMFGSRENVKMMARARMVCGRPDLARRMYRGQF
ncbi:MAG: hypothetical protein ACRBCT_02415 [Alphaproteobacteria bacterium]